MKRLLLSTAALLAVCTVNAQIVNGNLDTWASNEPSSWLFNFGTANLYPGTNNYVEANGEGDPLTTTEIAGSGGTGSAAELETKAVVGATAIADGFDTQIEGLLIGLWTYAATPSTISFMVDAQPIAGDSCIFQALVYNASGQAIGYAEKIYDASNATTDWTAETLNFTMIAGTPAVIRIWAQTSYTESDADDSGIGSIMRVDNITLVDASGASVEDITALNFGAYPNPAADVLNFKSDEPVASVAIYGLDGKLMMSAESTTTLNVSELNAGMYIYEVTTVEGSVVRDSFMKK